MKHQNKTKNNNNNKINEKITEISALVFFRVKKTVLVPVFYLSIPNLGFHLQQVLAHIHLSHSLIIIFVDFYLQ